MLLGAFALNFLIAYYFSKRHRHLNPFFSPLCQFVLAQIFCFLIVGVHLEYFATGGTNEASAVSDEIGRSLVSLLPFIFLFINFAGHYLLKNKRPPI